MPTPTTPRRVLVLSASALVSAGLLWAFLRARSSEDGSGRDSVELVDNAAELSEFLAGRALPPPDSRPLDSTGQPAAEGYPPPLVLEVMDRADAARFFPALDKGLLYDPLVYLRREPRAESWHALDEHPGGGWTLRTNDLGLRNDDDPADPAPELRVLVTGDSHTDGVCNNEESFAGVLATRLAERTPGRSVDVLNAALGGYNFYNYLGVPELHRDLGADLLVVTVYGGNDFYMSLGLHRYFHRLPPPAIGPRRPRRLLERRPRLSATVPQEIGQVLHFLNNPDDVALAVDVAATLSLAIRDRCEDAGSRVLFVYLPPALAAQPKHFSGASGKVQRTLIIDRDDILVSDRIADEWLSFLDERSIPHLDLRPVFSASDTAYYWRSDFHLNLDGHVRVAELLAPLVEALVDPD